MKDSETITNQVYWTTVTVTPTNIAWYNTPASQNITIAVTNPDIVFVYIPRNDIEYTVTYKDTNGNILLTDKFVNNGVMDTDVTETAPEIDGYTAQTGSFTITLKANNNHIDFVYTPNTNISYTVYYKSWDVTLHAAKTVNNQTMASTVIEDAEVISWYTVDQQQKSLKLWARDNTITFNYTPDSNISYTVKYQTVSGSWLAEDKVVNNQTMASTVTENAISIDWYTVITWEKDLTLQATNNVIIFQYTPNEYAITFVDESNSHDSVVRSWDYLTEVNQKYPTWTGDWYTIHWDKPIPVTMPLGWDTITATWTANSYIVSFDANQSWVLNPESKSVTYNSAYGTLPILSKDGYTFNGWKDWDDFVTAETIYTTIWDKTLVWVWTANGNTPYKIEHYKEMLDWTYEKDLTEDKTGESDTTATATPKTDYVGFTYSWAVEWTKISGNIAWDGSLVLKLYYTRNSYDVEYQFTNTPNWHSSLPTTQKYKYWATVNIAANATAPWYSFAWNRTESFLMPSEDIIITGTFIADTTTPYTVKYYYQQANGLYPTTANVINTSRTWITDTTANVIDTDKVPAEDGYIFDSTNANNVLQWIIAGNGSLVLKVYFKKQFTVRYTKWNKGTFEDVVYENLDYNALTPNSDSELTGQHLSWYTFNGWTPERLENVTWDQTYTATWSANINTLYTVEIYEQQADGTWLETPTTTIDRLGTTDTTAEVTILDKTKAWYVLDESKANVLSGNIEWNGSLILKVYLKKQFTVTYKPWAHGTFLNDEHSDLDYGTSTPAFAWDINSHEDGYIFSGWDVEISATVTSNTTYTAIWWEDKNHNGQNDAKEDKYTVTITYVYSRGWEAKPTYTLENQLSWFTYNVDSPSIANYFADKLNLSGIITNNINEVVTYRPNNDTNNNGYADEWEDKYTITVYYNFSRWWKAADTQSWEYLSWIEYSFTSPDVEYYTQNIAEISGTTTWTVNYTVIYSPVHDVNGNEMADEEEIPFTVRFLPWTHGTLWVITEYSVLSWLKLSDIEWYQTPTITANTHYVFSWWSPSLNINSKVLSDITYTVIWWEDFNGNGQNDEFETKYTVIYTDWVDNEEIFADQKTENILSWTITPAFIWTPIRENYVFSWWTSSIADKVTANVTYTAQWKDDINDNWIADEDETPHVLTIMYRYSREEQAHQPVIASYLSWISYSVISPIIANYKADKLVVEWIMWEEDKLIVVTYTPDEDENHNGYADGDEPKYTVIYTDWVDWEVVFVDQKIENILSWTVTPEFNWTPIRENYVFSWWTPSVADKVTENAIYTAQWKEDTNNNGIADEEETPHILTIIYRYSRGGQASETVIDSYLSWINYSITSPIIANYIADKLTVSWTMSGEDKTIIVTYRPERDENHNDIPDQEEVKYTAIVHYVYSRGWVAHADKIQQDIVSGLNYSIISPVIPYYTPSEQTISWTITWENVEFTVVYTPITDVNGNEIADEEEPKYTVIYTDWVDGEVVFADQITKNILSWADTPAFNWSTTRLNYIFSWWTPSIEEKVTTNATYTAKWKEDMNNNGIDDSLETKYMITFKDWENILSTQEVVSWAVIVLPVQPTKIWYTFDGWDGLPEDWKIHGKELTIIAKWKVVNSNTNKLVSAGGWRIIKDLNKNDTKEHNSANLSWTDLTWNQTKFEPINWDETVKYSQEVLDAYTWAYSKDITTLAPINEAKPDWWLYRQHMAKMIVNFAVNVLWREIPEEGPQKCSWEDRSNAFESKEMKEYAVKACKLWLMWIDMDYFQPESPVTRAQFGTILSRLLWWKKYAWWTPYYSKHLNVLEKNGIMTQIENPEKRIELREWVWVMLMRLKDSEKF